MDTIHNRTGPEFQRFRRSNAAAWVSPEGIAILDALGEFGPLDASRTAA